MTVALPHLPHPTKEGTIPLEPYGEGVNAYIYFVSNTLGGPLQQLPYVTPEQVRGRAPPHTATRLCV